MCFTWMFQISIELFSSALWYKYIAQLILSNTNELLSMNYGSLILILELWFLCFMKHWILFLTSKKFINEWSDKVDRAVSTAIYFLLPSGSVARIHRIPCAETFHHYIGDPITVWFILLLEVYLMLLTFACIHIWCYVQKYVCAGVHCLYANF